jgi:large subunit ribosomal protein L6
MSRIGKLPIKLPSDVKFEYGGSKVTVEGPKGKLEKTVSFNGKIESDKDSVTIISPQGGNNDKAVHGLIRSLVNSMIVGVTEGFAKTLKIVGVGYKAQIQGKKLVLNLGHSHPVDYPVPEDIKIEVPDINTVIVSGIDKQRVGQTASEIRDFRPPEPYKGKGVMYSNEHIRRKAGKAGIK